ncbi:yemanuclein isoform X2 [Uranotaenia lowii]|uniref:yemanuclein isoform X2 n=1 Tax=Uranotaenia lowii TaxID=190385 RepID=UPI00247A0766|nr:yemanuclein isoform X2 [Uranotaenia lowii]
MEKKRVTLTTIGDVVKKSPFGGGGSSPFGPNSDNFFGGAFGGVGPGLPPVPGSSGPSTKNGTAKERKTVRLELKLFEPTANSFPEFNFAKLVREERKRQRKVDKKVTANGFLSDAADGDDDVARIAKELEKKYGAGTAYSSSGKFARSSQLDYCDRGYGYDEDDSFIDNTEAYDELIPQEVETVCGGFYINSGQLVFTTLSNFERPEDAVRMPKPKKRPLSSSSESSEPEETTPSTSKAKRKDELGSATSGAESGPGKSRKVERKKLNGHLGKKQKTSGDERPPLPQKEGKKKKEIAGGKEIKVVKTTTVKDMLKAKRDSFRKMTQEKKGRSSGSVSSSESGDDEDRDEDGSEDEDGSDGSDSDSSGSSSDDSDSESASENEKDGQAIGSEASKKNEINLPDNLPDHLLQDLRSLREVPKNAKGKVNFFDNSVADLLLQIDVSSRICGGSARNAIYKHLEDQLKVSRQTLMIKIKKIRIRKEDNKVKKALGKLEDAVTEVMPKIITNYEQEKLKVSELRIAMSVAGVENGDKAEIKSPKKKFPWNDQIRNLLFDIATIRKQSFHILRPRKETEEDFINTYLKKNVVPLWPSGWIKFEDLQRELDRRKKPVVKQIAKDLKKASLATNPVPVSSATPTSSASNKAESVLTPVTKTSNASKLDEKKIVKLPQSSPSPAASLTIPPISTSPSSAKKTSDHSIINIISSPPSKSSAHSSPYQPPRPQSQPHNRGFDEDLIQTHVINLDKGDPPGHHSSSGNLTNMPKDLRISSPALSSASSASSSRRPSCYMDQPPMAHTTPSTSTIHGNSPSQRKDRRSLDDDSDSSIEIVGEYNVWDGKKVDPLNLALPTINKDKYKKINSITKGSNKGSMASNITPVAFNQNNNLDKAAKYAKASGSVSAPVGGFALPTMAMNLMPNMKTSNSGPSSLPRMQSAPGELDVMRIMKELQELQAVQISTVTKTGSSNDGHKATHSSAPSKNQPHPTNANQHQQQSHHSSSSGLIDCDSFESDYLFANYTYDTARKRSSH